MLDYIRSQINARVNENAVKTPAAEDIPDDVVLEYAHIFQELDDVSIEGAEVDKARKMSLDIPFEDEDVEIDNIEFNLNDGRVTDVPGDASVQEAYADIKTYEKFYQETYDETTRLPRETDGMFEKRVAADAAKKYAEYCETAMEQGLFGFDDISVTDSRVPSKMNVDFGSVDEKDDSKSFFGKVKTFFATDKDHNIKKHQLDSVNLVKNGAFSKIGKPLMAYMESKYDVPTGASVWDVVTPMNIYVPRNNGDSFCVVLEYMNELTNKKEYFGWTRPVNDDVDSIENMEKLNMESFVNETHYENHDVVVQEAAMREEVSKKRTYSRFYQEAIDFGGADGDSNDAGSDLPPADDSTDTPDDSSTSTSNDDPVVDTGNASDAPESNDDASTGDDSGKEQAVVNDVSQQIAEKVADQTKADAQDDSSASTDDDTSVSFDDDDMNTGDDTAEGNASIDDQLDDLDNTTSDDSMDDMEDDDTAGDVDTTDFDNMTIDQLIEQGSEKLKGMTLQEIKDFINSGDNDAIQEAFILTKKNINQEVDNNIRACLGLLNDNKMDLDKIIRKFKFSGHKLNRTLTKAIKMKDVYSSNEVKDLQKLNKSLADLMTSLRKSKDNTYVAQIKNNIRVFVSQCKVVSDFIEDKIKGGTMNAIQEGFFITRSNVKSKLAKVLVPVHGNMKEIEKLADAGKLTRGRIIKMYNNPGSTFNAATGSSTSTTNSSIGSGGRYGMFRGADAANNLDEAIRLLNRIIRKKADVIDEATFDTVNTLADDLDVFGDYVETVIDDKNENKSAVKFIGKQAKKIIALINELVDIDEDDVKNNLPEEDIVSDTTPSVDDVNNDDDTSIEDTSSEDPEFDEGESDSDVDIPDETSEDENEDNEDDDSSSEEDED